jgi:HlyD family secretion protein
MKMAVLGGVVVALGATIAFGRTGEDANAAEMSADVAVAEARDLAVRAEAAGEIEPIQVVEVKSKASGEILRLLVSTGDRVEAGTVLAEIDPRDVQNALDQAEADQAVAEVQAQTTRSQRERVEELRKAAAMTQQEYESAVQAEATAQAQLVRARTNLQLARMRRNDVSIAAPITGTIIERPVEAGQIITSATGHMSGGTTLITMADLGEMQVRALVDETDIGRVARGQPADVSVDAFPGRAFPGEVLKVEPRAVIEQNVTMFPVLVQLDNREGLLMPGMNADVEIHIARRTKVVAIPTGAVVDLADAAGALLGVDLARVNAANAAATKAIGAGTQHALVFVQTTSGVEPRRVVIGVSDWEHTEVVSGLGAGETVKLVSVARMRAEQTNVGPGPAGPGS